MADRVQVPHFRKGRYLPRLPILNRVTRLFDNDHFVGIFYCTRVHSCFAIETEIEMFSRMLLLESKDNKLILRTLSAKLKVVDAIEYVLSSVFCVALSTKYIGQGIQKLLLFDIPSKLVVFGWIETHLWSIVCIVAEAHHPRLVLLQNGQGQYYDRPRALAH